MRELRLPLVAAVFVGVVLIGLGARSIYYQKRVIDPLAAAAAEVPGVLAIDVVTTASGGKEVVARLGPDVPLESTYVLIEELSQTALGSAYGRLRIEDRRTPRLVEAYHRIHFALQEAVMTGRFAAMSQEVEARLSEFPDVAHWVYVGDRHLFVRLTAGENYLYEVIARPQALASSHFLTERGSAPW